MMVHSTMTMTLRYSHLAPGGGREFIEALDGAPAARLLPGQVRRA